MPQLSVLILNVFGLILCPCQVDFKRLVLDLEEVYDTLTLLLLVCC